MAQEETNQPTEPQPAWLGRQKAMEHKGYGYVGDTKIITEGRYANVERDRLGRAIKFDGQEVKRDPRTDEITHIGEEKASGDLRRFLDVQK